jgi:chromosome partitioning protein
MLVITLAAQKGGAGKTTLATAMAVEATRRGMRAALLDLDPQCSASLWGDLRQDKALEVVATPEARLVKVLEAARGQGLDLVVIDTPPSVKETPIQAIRSADVVVVPVKPAMFDLAASRATLDAVKREGKRSIAVISMAPLQGREVKDAEAMLTDLGAAVAPVRIIQRVAHSRAQQHGMAASEFEPEGKAAGEMAQLFDHVLETLKAQAAA